MCYISTIYVKQIKGTEAAADCFFFFNVRELKLGGNDLCGSR